MLIKRYDSFGFSSICQTMLLLSVCAFSVVGDDRARDPSRDTLYVYDLVSPRQLDRLRALIKKSVAGHIRGVVVADPAEYEAAILRRLDGARVLAIDSIRPNSDGRGGYQFTDRSSPQLVFVLSQSTQNEEEDEDDSIKISVRVVGPLVTTEDARRKTFAIQLTADHKLGMESVVLEIELHAGQGGFHTVELEP